MSSQAQVVVWLLAELLVAVNGLAAGVSAALHVWAPRIPRPGRILLAAGAAGLFPASFMVLALIDPTEFGPGSGAVALLVSAGLFGVGALASLPGGGSSRGRWRGRTSASALSNSARARRHLHAVPRFRSDWRATLHEPP